MLGGGVCEGPKRKRGETVELERETMYQLVAHPIALYVVDIYLCFKYITFKNLTSCFANFCKYKKCIRTLLSQYLPFF